MTVFSAVTYATGYSLSVLLHPEIRFSPKLFIRGYFFVLFCQLTAHFLGEYYDLPSDCINDSATKFTGGSKVLVKGGIKPEVCLLMGYVTTAFTIAIIHLGLPTSISVLAYAMLFLAHQYSSPPFKFNHRGLGELSAATVMNWLLPYFAATLHSPRIAVNDLSLLIVPAFIIKFALFLVLNLADYEADKKSGKNTLAVLLGPSNTRRLHYVSMIMAYASVVGVLFFSPPSKLGNIFDGFASILIFSTLPLALKILKEMNSSVNKVNNGRSLDAKLLLHSLQHAPSPVLAMTAAVLAYELFMLNMSFTTTLKFSFYGFADALISPNFLLRQLPLLPFIYTTLLAKSPQNLPRSNMSSMQRQDSVMSSNPTVERPIVIIGGGMGGLTLAILFKENNIPFVLIEKRSSLVSNTGADLGLWPSAIKVLESLGISGSFFEDCTAPVSHVRMLKQWALYGSWIESTLRIVNMSSVTAASGNNFRLVSRHSLLQQLYSILKSPSDGSRSSMNITYDAKVTSIIETKDAVQICYHQNGVSRTVLADLVVGADGINSAVRQHILHFRSCPSALSVMTDLADVKNVTSARYAGEICFRGVLELSEPSPKNSSPDLDIVVKALQDDVINHPNTMPLIYGPAFRAAYGYLNSAHTKIYWWIKMPHQLASNTIDQNDWPEDCPYQWAPVFKSLWKLTRAEVLTGNDSKIVLDRQWYVQPIIDRVPNNQWFTKRVVLLGDAAHPVTPNMGQGATMAIEDAYVLSHLLSKYPFLNEKSLLFSAYFNTRWKHVSGVAKESYKQAKLGQLKNPVLVWLRECILKWLPNSFFEKKLRQVNVWDADEAIRELENEIGLSGQSRTKLG
ncbi:hypothetical protein BKA69DRAFT_1121359 [Paraphysoderma sedebokerense]|nr:hypothetical protein BKA69DRAFT_1121359 [Paraphysoderma sedebokerense]